MRIIALEGLAVVAALVFVTMSVATAMHRPSRGSEVLRQGSALAEYLWTVVPWLIMAACVLPSVRRIVAGG
jgi:heme/copper-type cytochrome/quinol oxidase subunit 2